MGVVELSREVEETGQRLDFERRQLRGQVIELEQQLQSMAMGYEQVERTSEQLAREGAQLRAALELVEETQRVTAGLPGGGAAQGGAGNAMSEARRFALE